MSRPRLTGSRPTANDVIDFYGDRLLCDRCGAHVSTYDDKCPTLDPCEGFWAYENLLKGVKSASRDAKQ